MVQCLQSMDHKHRPVSSGADPWCGSRSGSGSADTCLRCPDQDPAIFVIDLQDAQEKYFKKSFPAYYFLTVQSQHFSKKNVKKKSQSSRNQGFSYYFCLVIEGSGSGSRPLTNGSGSRRLKNIRIRIRIRNTASKY